MTAVTSPTTRRKVGGWAALAAALLWGVKAASILLTGYQPPVVFEAAPPLFGLAVFSLALGSATRRRRTAQVLGLVACVAGLVALASELAGEVWGPAIAGAMVAALAGLVLIGLDTRRASGRAGTAGKLALAIGLGTMPAVLLGGLLATIDERLLEVPLLFLACLWGWLGTLLLRD